jgi:hypothetical protein
MATISFHQWGKDMRFSGKVIKVLMKLLLSQEVLTKEMGVSSATI